jgi:hypothetical protein
VSASPVTSYGKGYGLYSRVARQLGVSPSHVRKVNLGLHKSKRVEDALLRAAGDRPVHIEQKDVTGTEVSALKVERKNRRLPDGTQDYIQLNPLSFAGWSKEAIHAYKHELARRSGTSIACVALAMRFDDQRPKVVARNAWKVRRAFCQLQSEPEAAEKIRRAAPTVRLVTREEEDLIALGRAYRELQRLTRTQISGGDL